MKDYQAALADLNQAIKLQPDDADPYYWRGNIYKDLKDNKAALADYNQAIKLQPDNAYAVYLWLPGLVCILHQLEIYCILVLFTIKLEKSTN